MEAVRAFKLLPEAEALAAANKRIQNILKKTEAVTQAPDMALFAEDAERALIRSAIKRNGGSVPAAAEALGLSRSAMYRRLEKLGLKPDEL